MEAVIHETFGDITLLDAHLLEGSQVDDELMSTLVFVVSVENLIVILKLLRHVIGVENCHAGGPPQTFLAQELDESI